MENIIPFLLNTPTFARDGNILPWQLTAWAQIILQCWWQGSKVYSPQICGMNMAPFCILHNTFNNMTPPGTQIMILWLLQTGWLSCLVGGSLEGSTAVLAWGSWKFDAVAAVTFSDTRWYFSPKGYWTTSNSSYLHGVPVSPWSISQILQVLVHFLHTKKRNSIIYRSYLTQNNF